MALQVLDANSTKQTLPNSGLDTTVYHACDTGSITTANTNATDVYQMVGAAGIIARIRRIEVWCVTVASSATLASTRITLRRRTGAGTTGAWTALSLSGGTLGQSLATAAAPSVTVNKAGTTAFTVGAGNQAIGGVKYVYVPSIGAVTTINEPPVPAVWEFGTRGCAPVYLVGASDFLTLDLAGVTPISTLAVNIEWDESAV
jgi:hypothetical protein